MKSRVALAWVAAACLVVVAVVHVKLALADGYTSIGTRPFSLGDQFLAQSAAAVVLAALLLLRPRPLVWWGVAVLSALSILGLLLSRTVGIPLPGLPVPFVESWLPSAVLSLVVEVVALICAVLALLHLRRGSASG